MILFRRVQYPHLLVYVYRLHICFPSKSRSSDIERYHQATCLKTSLTVDSRAHKMIVAVSASNEVLWDSFKFMIESTIYTNSLLAIAWGFRPLTFRYSWILFVQRTLYLSITALAKIVLVQPKVTHSEDTSQLVLDHLLTWNEQKAPWW